MKQIRTLRANGITFSIVGDNSRMCRGVLEILSDCGAGDIHLHIVDVYGVRRSNGLAEYLVD